MNEKNKIQDEIRLGYYREIIQKELNDDSVQAKLNPLKYLPKLGRSLYNAFGAGLIDREQASAEVIHCLHELYRLHADGNANLLSEIDMLIKDIAAFFICDFFVEYFEDDDSKELIPIVYSETPLHAYDDFEILLLENYFKEAVFLKDLTAHDQTYSSLVIFMADQMAEHQKSKLINLKGDHIDRVLGIQKETLFILETLQRESKGDYLKQIAETCFNLAENTNRKYEKLVQHYDPDEQDEITISSHDITTAITYAQKTLTIATELFSTGKIADRNVIANTHQLLAELYIKMVKVERQELFHLPSQESLIEQKQYRLEKIHPLLSCEREIEWTVRDDKRVKIAECEEKIRSSFANAIEMRQICKEETK